MNSILLTDSNTTLNGLKLMMLMMQATDKAEDVVQSYVEVSTALLIVEVAKIAEDKPEWFPKGKWATIQSIQDKIHIK